MEFIPIVGMLSSTAMVVLIVFFISHAKQRKAEVQAEVQSRLISRFGTAPELIEFLQSPAGQEFVSGAYSAPANYARERIMSGFTRAIVLSMLGIAFLGLGFYYEDDDFTIMATIVSSLGIGYLLATIVSYRLSARMHGGDALRSSAGMRP